MPKRRLCSDCSKRLCRRCYELLCRSKQEHLYLVVDDWDSGYSFREIDLPSASSSGDGGAAAADPTVQRLLPPAFMRMVAERGSPEYFTAGFGFKIVMMHPRPINAGETAAPLIDVDARVVTLGPEATSCLSSSSSRPIYIPVGSDKLFAMDVSSFEICCCSRRPKPGDAAMFPSLLQARGDWSWRELQMQPFDRLEVSSYAVDNQEQTIFVSTKGGGATTDDEATFIFDIGESCWKPYGKWAMPFNGRGYYDRGLDGFVGISKDPDTLGHLYVCDMTKTDDDTTGRRNPDVKCSKVKVFNKNPAVERHLGATLMYMRHSKFCIVECVSITGDVEAADNHQAPPQELIGAEASSGSFNMYRVITFTIRYDKRADLRVKNYRTHCYEVPRQATSEFINGDPVAYWL